MILEFHNQQQETLMDLLCTYVVVEFEGLPNDTAYIGHEMYEF